MIEQLNKEGGVLAFPGESIKREICVATDCEVDWSWETGTLTLSAGDRRHTEQKLYVDTMAPVGPQGYPRRYRLMLGLRGASEAANPDETWTIYSGVCLGIERGIDPNELNIILAADESVAFTVSLSWLVGKSVSLWLAELEDSTLRERIHSSHDDDAC